MPFSINHLTALLDQCHAVKRLWIAYSGGVDSHSLLNHVISLKQQLPEIAGAIHVHHGLSPFADQWLSHCQSICEQYGIPCKYIKVNAVPMNGESPEEAARRARYEAFEDFIKPDDALLLAQHQDDQAETFLYQALRGSGPHGLAAMPTVKSFAGGFLVRPMLDISRQHVIDYADENQLNWIEDESNQEIDADRNFLRQEIMPLLRQRWPAVSRTLSRAARHTATQTTYADACLHEELKSIQGSRADTLSIRQLTELPFEQATLFFRAKVRALSLPIPATHHVKELIGRQLHAGQDRQLMVNWPGVEIRRYRDDLYILPPLKQITASGWSRDWQPPEACPVPELGGVMEAEQVIGQGISLKYCADGLTIRPRQGGERCKPVSKKHHYDLKKLYQDAHIPPWERVRLPLIFAGDDLAAVANHWVCDEFAAASDEPGYVIGWHMPDLSESD